MMKTLTLEARPTIFIYFMISCSILFFASCILMVAANGQSLLERLDDLWFVLAFSLFFIVITIPLWKSRVTAFDDDTIHIQSWRKDYQFSVADIKSYRVFRQAGNNWMTLMQITFKGNIKYQIWKPLGWTKFKALDNFISDARDRTKYPNKEAAK